LTITAWRIVKRKLARRAFSGEGARRYGGRWNSKGVAVVYLAQTQSLAALEILVHADYAELLQHYVVIPVSMAPNLIIRVDVSRLPRNWRAYPPPNGVRAIGDNWVAAGGSAVLQVPSVIVPSESNFLVNPLHPDYAKLKIGNPVPFKFDPRLTSDS
jgi:RES domain-containing protein